MLDEVLARVQFVTSKFKNFENALGTKYIKTAGAPYTDYSVTHPHESGDTNEFTKPEEPLAWENYNHLSNK